MRLKVACKACDAKKQHQKYEQLEEEAEAIDLAAQAAEGRKSPVSFSKVCNFPWLSRLEAFQVTIPFYFEQSYNFDLEEAYNVPVHKDTIAYDALTVLSNVRVLDEFFSYSVVELWETFSAGKSVFSCLKNQRKSRLFTDYKGFAGVMSGSYRENFFSGKLSSSSLESRLRFI